MEVRGRADGEQDHEEEGLEVEEGGLWGEWVSGFVMRLRVGEGGEGVGDDGVLRRMGRWREWWASGGRWGLGYHFVSAERAEVLRR